MNTVLHRPVHVNLVITGRDAPEELVNLARTVTSMDNVKHAYDRRIKVMKGIDYWAAVEKKRFSLRFGGGRHPRRFVAMLFLLPGVFLNSA